MIIKIRIWSPPEKMEDGTMSDGYMDYNPKMLWYTHHSIVKTAEEKNIISQLIEKGFIWKINEYLEKEKYVMQYIGKKDKNKNEIYSGDIIDFFDEVDAKKGEEKEARGIVKFDDARFYIEQYRFFKDMKCYVAYYVPPDWSKVKVIDNIYENPELAKEIK